MTDRNWHGPVIVCLLAALACFPSCTESRGQYNLNQFKIAENLTLRYWMPRLGERYRGNEVDVPGLYEYLESITGVHIEFEYADSQDAARQLELLQRSENLPDIVEWNLKFLGGLNGHPLRDKRVVVKTGDILELLRESEQAFDTILLDVDNGPRAMVSAGNRGLYTMPGIRACCRALTAKGCLAVWSSHADKPFERRLMKAGLHVRRFSAPAYKGSKSQYRYIWIASASTASLPPGGGEPLLTPPRLRGGRAPFQRRRY